jgi:tripartite-type tricarboxylate transporter receptor subunit TctC
MSIRLLLLILLGLSLGTEGAQAAYPDRPIRLVVPFPPGGPDQSVASAVGPELGKILGQQVVIDYVAGRDGVVGTDLVARAPADGYTLLVTPSSFAIHPGTFGKLPFDSESAFAAVSLLLVAQYALVVNPTLPVESVEELIAYAQSHPGKLSYASAGAGGPTQLGFELFKITSGVDIAHVPYEGGGRALAAVAAGKAQVMLAPLIAAIPMIAAGKVRGLAVSGGHRAAALPDLPTIERTLPGFTAVTWYGVLAPADTPKPIIARLSAAFDRVVHQPEIVARFAAIGGEPVGGPPATLAALIRAEIPRWIRVAKEAGVHVN